MKKLLLILLCLPMIGFGQESNPCKDALFLQLKNKNLDDMSEREYKYFLTKDEQCHQKSNRNPKIIDNQPNLNQNIKLEISTPARTSLERRKDWDLGLVLGFYAITAAVGYSVDVNTGTGKMDAPMIFFPVIGPFFVAAQETTESKYAVPLILSGLAQSGFLIDYILTSKKIRLLENDNLSYSINPNPIYPSLTFVYNLD